MTKAEVVTELLNHAFNTLDLPLPQAGPAFAVACAWCISHSVGATPQTVEKFLPSMFNLIRHHSLAGLATAQAEIKGRMS